MLSDLLAQIYIISSFKVSPHLWLESLFHSSDFAFLPLFIPFLPPSLYPSLPLSLSASFLPFFHPFVDENCQRFIFLICVSKRKSALECNQVLLSFFP